MSTLKNIETYLTQRNIPFRKSLATNGDDIILAVTNDKIRLNIRGNDMDRSLRVYDLGSGKNIHLNETEIKEAIEKGLV